MLACIYLSYIFSIVCGVNIYIYLGLYCCPHNSLSSTSLKYHRAPGSIAHDMSLVVGF